jgi:hypothetical protein
MIKSTSLRAALVQADPSLARDPDRLRCVIEEGELIATLAPTASFEYRYRLNVLLLDYTGDTDCLMVALLVWIRRHQPDCLAPSAKSALSFEVELLDHASCDLSITLALSERVMVTPQPDGGWQIEHADEPENLP